MCSNTTFAAKSIDCAAEWRFVEKQMKKVWSITALWLITGFLFLFPAVALAENLPTEPKGLTMKAEVGFAGTYRMEYWTPVRVSVENTGSDLEGSLEVPVSNGSGQTVVYETPVLLPNSSSKEYTIYVKMRELIRSLEIRLTDGKGKVVKTIKAENLNPVSMDHYFLGLVTDDEPSLGYWKERTEGNLLFADYQPVSFTSEDFPDRREVLDNFSVLIFNHIDTGAFRPEQTDALDAWIKGGGILIVGTGGNGNRTLAGLSDRIVPAAPGEITEQGTATRMEEISGKPILGPVPLSVMDVQTEGGTVIVSQDASQEAGQDAIPGSVPDTAGNSGNLVWMDRKGSGVIYVAAFDMGTEPILSWAGNKLFWENLLADSLPEKSALMLRDPYGSRKERSGMDEVLGYIKAMELPSIAVILFLFLLYLAMVGPLNYMVLKKMDKREWSWFTIPALSVIFAFLIYGLGYNIKGSELIMNTVSIVDMNSDSKNAALTDYVGVFIPRRGDYRIEVDRDTLLSLNDPNNNYPVSQGGSKDASEVRIIQGKPSRILFRNSNVWTMQTFQTDTWQVDYGSINADLYYEMGKIKGTVENNTPYPLEDFAFYTSAAYSKVGNIAAGEKKNVELVLPQQSRFSAYNNYQTMLDSLYPYPSGTTAGKDQNREALFRRRLLENLLMNSGAATKEYVPTDKEKPFHLNYLAFYGGDPDGSVEVNGKQPDISYGRGVIMGSMGFQTEKEGYVSIPPGMLYGKLEQDMSKNIYGGKEANAVTDDAEVVMIEDFRDYAVFSVDLSQYTQLSDLKAEISLEFLSGQGTVLIFDLEQKDYVEADGKTISIDESNLGRYVDPDGMVYLKVQPRIDDRAEVMAPMVILEGRAD